MKAAVLDDLLLASATVDALEVAATRRRGSPLGTFDILTAIIEVDQLGDWTWVQLNASPIAPPATRRFHDKDRTIGGHWRNVPLTADATRALKIAAQITDLYRLYPMPPGVMALGLIWYTDFGASRALLQGSDLNHEHLLELVQDAIIGTRLTALVEAVGNCLPAERSVSSDPQYDRPTSRQLEELLRVAADAVPTRIDRAYVLLTTSAVMLALLWRDRPLWEQAAARIGISLDAYEANLRWAYAHPTETLGTHETQLDATLTGIRLTVELSEAIDAARRIAPRLAGSETPDVAVILPPILLTVTGVDARVGLDESARLALRQALLQVVHGALVPDLDALLAGVPAAPAPSTRAHVPPVSNQPARSETVGFNIGSFVGAFIVAVFGGVPLTAALFLAWVVRTVAARARKRARSRRLLPAMAAGTLVVAVALAATATTDFKDDRQAVRKLGMARQAIGREDLVEAMRELGGAALLQNQSVSIRVLSSCVDWALGFTDAAALEAQMALNLGYRPGAATHYRGRGCFLDTPNSHGVTFMRAGKAHWLILPRPDAKDAAGRRYLEIAEQERSTRPTESFVALGCLAHRYDFRLLAAFMFTVGLNGNLRLGGRPTPHPEIRRCLRARSASSGYKFSTDPLTHAEVFSPVDLVSRFPNPSRPRPPAGACWAKFPRSGPCNTDVR